MLVVSAFDSNIADDNKNLFRHALENLAQNHKEIEKVVHIQKTLEIIAGFFESTWARRGASWAS